MSLLEQNITQKGKVDKKTLKLDTGNKNNKGYKFKAI